MAKLFTKNSAEEDQVVLMNELRSINHDFKACVVAAEVVTEAGLDQERIFFRNMSSFRRQISRDIEHITWSEVENYSAQLVFELNREGIYDMLPEALVHVQSSNGRETSVEWRNELRAQETQARAFFSPLENEFAHRTLILDIIERELLKNNNPERNREFFEYFFGDSAMLTDGQVVILIHILPLCHKIRGDESLIGLAISKIIGYPITVTSKWVATKIAIDTFNRPPESWRLGTTMILNDNCVVPGLHYEIEVSEVETHDYNAFTRPGKHFNVINFIIPYFFPADADISISMKYTKSGKKIMMFDDEGILFLGFNTYI